MENKTYKLSTGITVRQKRITIKMIYQILQILKKVKSNISVDLSNLENLEFENIIDAIITSDLLGSLLKIILIPVDSSTGIDATAINFDDVELDDAFGEVMQDFFTINKTLPMILKLIKQNWA